MLQPALQLSGLFTDHMVLQHGVELSISGVLSSPIQTSSDGGPSSSEPSGAGHRYLQITIAQHERTVQVNQDGTWSVTLPALDPGGPYSLRFFLGAHPQSDSMSILHEVRDVLIGEVWVAGGQSNMEWKMSWGINAQEQEIQSALEPRIRFFDVPNTYASVPSHVLPGGVWKVASPETAGEFSAVAWFFAKNALRHRNIPIGIIESNWGGTPVEAWMSRQALTSLPVIGVEVADLLDAEPDWEARMATSKENDRIKWFRIEDEAGVNERFTTLSESGEFSTRLFPVHLPSGTPLSDFSWLQHSFDLTTEDLQGERFTLELEPVSQEGFVFINDSLVVRKSWNTTGISAQISSDRLREGRNTLTLRVANSWNNEVRIGSQGRMNLHLPSRTHSLEGEWRTSNTLEEPMPVVERFEWTPTFLYNAMIHPLHTYPIQGVIWYQGEANTTMPSRYNSLFSTMIREWRDAWGLGEFPFLFVQLANYLQRVEGPQESVWAELREAQRRTLSEPKTGMAVSIDIGEADDIHPRNKQDVGYRLWLQSTRFLGVQQSPSQGPEPVSAVKKGRFVHVEFSSVGKGLRCGECENGFEIAGADGTFSPVKGGVYGSRVRLDAEGIRNPRWVRYAWKDNPEAILWNSEGLPATPFQIEVER